MGQVNRDELAAFVSRPAFEDGGETPVPQHEPGTRARTLALPVIDVTTLPVLLTVAEVAGLIRKTRKAVYKLVERGAIPGVFRPDQRSLLFRRDELLRWINQERATSPGGTRR